MSIKDICRQNRDVLGGIDKAEEIAEQIENGEFVQLPPQAYHLIRQIAVVAVRNMRGLV